MFTVVSQAFALTWHARSTIRGPSSAGGDPASLSILSSKQAHITNSGMLIGGVLLSTDNDTFNDFQKIGKVIK